MPDLTPDAELRAAATTLRACAAAVEPDVAILHDVPWETESCDAGCQCIVSQTEPGTADIARVGRYIADAESPELADWIALMGPGMGPLLADWLEAVAAEMTSVDGTEYAYEEYPSWIAALATARAINSKEQP